MENQIPLMVNINKDNYLKVQDLLGYLRNTNQILGTELPTTDEEIINAALFHYFEKINNITNFFKIEKRALNLDDGTKIQNRIKEIIAMIGMKQSELARLTGIDKATISTMLSNHNQPSIEYFLRIWTVLGCPPVEEIFYREKV